MRKIGRIWLPLLLLTAVVAAGPGYGAGVPSGSDPDPDPGGGWPHSPAEPPAPPTDPGDSPGSPPPTEDLPEAHEGPPIDPDPDQDPHLPQVGDAIHCENGRVAQFPCHEIDLLGHVSVAELAGTPNATLNDVWGWTDPENGREYALVGLSNGVAFVDVTNPNQPRTLGRLPTRTVDSSWRDVKTFGNYAYVVADRAGVHGVQVFDLTSLRGVGAPQIFEAVRTYFGTGLSVGGGELLGSAHNIAINEQTGFAYVVGSGTCGEGLHMVSLNNPRRPRFAGCFGEDGYTHDVQCVVYHGPDNRHNGREICFAANEDTITVVDVSDKSRPRQLARVGYDGVAYAHQGWLTEDHRYFLSDDESDELRFGHGSRTYIWDVSDLDSPRLIGTHTMPLPATDHNLYIRGNRAYLANYASGLRVMDLSNVGQGRLTEMAYFDIVPETDAPGFVGAWSNYPFFASGTVLVSGIQQGLFLLRLH